MYIFFSVFFYMLGSRNHTSTCSQNLVFIFARFYCIFLGIQALIEREWIQAGHPFSLRHAKSCYSTVKSKGQQPTFLLFLDCVYQLHYQFPCSFEFTTNMLILLFEHSYFSQFGKCKQTNFLSLLFSDMLLQEHSWVIARLIAKLSSSLKKPQVCGRT